MGETVITETKILIGLTYLLGKGRITFDQLFEAAGMVMGLSQVPLTRGPAVPDTPSAPPVKQED